MYLYVLTFLWIFLSKKTSIYNDISFKCYSLNFFLNNIPKICDIKVNFIKYYFPHFYRYNAFT